MGRQLQNLSKTTTKKKSGAQSRHEQRAARDTEWDIRFNVSNNDPKDIVEIAKNATGITYVLISGEELGNAWQEQKMLELGQTMPGKEPYLHHHMCLVLHHPTNREHVAAMFGLKGRFYCTPRNRSYTYMGWKIHAMKPQTKTDRTRLRLYEAGNIPSDPITDKTRSQVEYMIKKYGTQDMKSEMRAGKNDLKNEEKKRKHEVKEKEKRLNKIRKLESQLEALRNKP